MFATGLISFLVLTLAQVPPLSGIPDLSTHKEIKVEVEIKASADTVWRILTNFPAYDIWNPYIYPASGDPIAGHQLNLTLRGGTVIHFHPTVLVAKPNQEISWGGKIPLGALERVVTFDITELEPHRVRLTAVERFRGIALPLASGVTGDAATGLKVMTKALRDRAELLDYVPSSSTPVVPHR
ncbi:MAG TPA: SRPBCC domain-containing protein [bacterium]|nr:SRPBCC domain-containing protein [bacterium]